MTRSTPTTLYINPRNLAPRRAAVTTRAVALPAPKPALQEGVALVLACVAVALALWLGAGAIGWLEGAFTHACDAVGGFLLSLRQLALGSC